MAIGMWINGDENGVFDPGDPGFTRGMTVFETLRTYGGRAFEVESHLDRLVESAAVMGVPFPGREVLTSEIDAASADGVWIRVSLTLGGQRVVESRALDMSKVGRPVRCATLRNPPPSDLPGFVKHCSRAAWNLAVARLGVDEVIFIDGDGLLLEANRSNVLGVVDGVLVTPPLDGRILAGVTRNTVLSCARRLGIAVIEAPLPKVSPFDELYLCSTLKELAPIAWLDDRSIGGGPVGAALMEEFHQRVSQLSS